MTAPSFELADEISKSLHDCEVMWAKFESFMLELEEFAKEDWISFKSKTYLFDEFLTQWFNLLRTSEVNPVSVRIQREIDQYRVSPSAFFQMVSSLEFLNKTTNQLEPFPPRQLSVPQKRDLLGPSCPSVR
ncbi:unnamed protein product [Dicrocoelium dendriticum]|nr:unnamed protein product [Dicrocoelium dendriticum]